MARTNGGLVQAVLGDDYGPREDGTLPDLTPSIESASGVVDVAVRLAADDFLVPGAASQELMERWLAAYFYTKSDPIYSSRSTGGASGSFLRDADEANPYLSGAFQVDTSGYLKAVMKRQVARGFHIGNCD